jgi:hypothetical protein
MGKAEPVDSNPIINEWGRTWAVPVQVRVVCAIPELEVGNLHTHMSLKLSLPVACLSMKVERAMGDF